METSKFGFIGTFKDSRLNKVGNEILLSMVSHGSSVLNRCAGGFSKAIKYYRFVNNPRVSMTDISQSIYDLTKANCKDKEVVIIQDTTEFNFEKMRQNFSEDDEHLGPTGNNKDIGYFMHCSMVIDADSSFPLGFSDIHLWNRQFGKQDRFERKYKAQPLEQKESFRWFKAIDNSLSVCDQASLCWFVSDRESDIYDVLAKFPMDKAHMIIRIAQNRSIKQVPSRLFEYIKTIEPTGSFPLEVIDKKSAEKKKVNIQVRYGQVDVKVPESSTSKNATKSVLLSFVEAFSEDSSTPINWRLFTDAEVTSLDQALKIIDRYKQRWHIEVLFGILKTKGFDVEQSQLETGLALKKLTLMTLIVALEVNQLRIAYKNADLQLDAKVVFSKKEIAILGVLLGQYQGNTEKQRNPFKANTLAWAAWIIGRMGGWKGLVSQGPPGIISFTEGYKQFKNACQIAEFFSQKDVYKA